MMESFEDLKVYQKAREFRKEMSEFVKTLPKEENYRLVDQLIQASRYITAQIAKGYGRFHRQENIQFCRIARGSLTEEREHLNVALDEGFISPENHKLYIEKQTDILRLLNGYINYLLKAKTK